MPKENAPQKVCFVVGPIGADDSPERIHADWLLEMIVLPVMADLPDFETKRADQIAAPGMIDAQVIDALLNADLVIADLSTLNPNAFYEIGIRHMAQKPIIHMQVAEERIPFDVSLYRAIKYSRQRPADLRAAQSALRAQVQAVLTEGYQVENPVTRTRGIVKIEQHATPELLLLHDQMKAMQRQIDKLKDPRDLDTTVDGWSAKPISQLAYEDDTLGAIEVVFDPTVPNAAIGIKSEMARLRLPHEADVSSDRVTLRFYANPRMRRGVATSLRRLPGVIQVGILADETS